jgi:2'-5' RNA ligase
VRLFVAAMPSEDVLDVIAALPRPDHPDLRWTTRDQWHVTLRFLGAIDDPTPVADALDATELGDPRDVRLGPAVRALGTNIVCVPVKGLDDVANQVMAATADIGEAPPKRAFRGHLTLARRRHGRGSLRRFTGAPVDASWSCTSVALVRSHLHPRGARYDVIYQFSLGS